MTTSALAAESISTQESKRLAALEAVIQSGEGALLATAHALRDIKIGKLYRENHATFEIYCQQRWGFTRQRGYQLVVFSEEVEMSTTVDTQPKTEREARQLRSDRKASDRKPIVDKVVNPQPVVDVEPVKPPTIDDKWREAAGKVEAPEPLENPMLWHNKAKAFFADAFEHASLVQLNSMSVYTAIVHKLTKEEITRKKVSQ